MHARHFDRLTKQVSRRGLAAMLGGGMLAGHASAAAKDGGSCGGQPTESTRLCRTSGACETDEDCAAGCACVERTISCCRTVRRRKRGKNQGRKGTRRCVRGRPGLYCAPAA